MKTSEDGKIDVGHTITLSIGGKGNPGKSNLLDTFLKQQKPKPDQKPEGK